MQIKHKHARSTRFPDRSVAAAVMLSKLINPYFPNNSNQSASSLSRPDQGCVHQELVTHPAEEAADVTAPVYQTTHHPASQSKPTAPRRSLQLHFLFYFILFSFSLSHFVHLSLSLSLSATASPKNTKNNISGSAVFSRPHDTLHLPAAKAEAAC